MPSATKDLGALGASIVLNVDSSVGLDGHGSVKGAFNYIQGTGSIDLEATLQVTDPADWFNLPDDIDGSPIATITSTGVTVFSINGYARIRAINVLAGAGNLCSLGFN